MKACSKKLLGSPGSTLGEQVREAIYLKHYSYRTEESYICRYVIFDNKQHPKAWAQDFTQKRGN